MFSTKLKFVFGLVLILFTSINIFAQDSAYEIEKELDKTLLKKDLLQVIEEAEKSSKNDIVSLYRRLILYHRAVNFEKASQVIKQIQQVEKQKGNSFLAGYKMKDILEDVLFKDVAVIQFYLQNYYMDESLFKKFIQLCKENKTACDVNGFDNWLGLKFLEHQKNDFEYDKWLGHHLHWREEFGLDKSELLQKFVVDFRNDPSNLVFALRYLRHFPKASTVEEIAEKFNSKQAYDYYELASRIINNGWYSSENAESIKIINQHGIAFLHKSLEIPFNNEDKRLMYEYALRMVSVQPNIGDYKKQFQYWVKTKLAKTYNNNGEADKAQPFAEELVRMDKSDIQTGNVEYLGGAVQAASGERVIEKKILSEQTNRENTSEYWIERANYYRGRNELKLVFDAYLEGLKTVPFDLNNEQPRRNRGYLIYELTRFSEDFAEYAEDLKDDDGYELSSEQKLKAEIWLGTEKFLLEEFERTKSNILYSYGLSQLIKNGDFNDLFVKIFNENTDLFVRYFREAYSNTYDYSNLISDIWESNGISQAKKDELFSQLFIIAQTSDSEKTFNLAGDINNHTDKYAVQLIAVLNRGLAKVEEELKAKNLSFTEREDLEYLKDNYLKLMFSNFLLAKNWRAAEKFMNEKFDWSESFSYDKYKNLERLAVSAAENRDSKDAIRFWKMRANLNRRDLYGLETLKKYDEARIELIDFYGRMKVNEPYSPIPEMALKILK